MEQERYRACRHDMEASDSDDDIAAWARKPYRQRCVRAMVCARRCLLMRTLVCTLVHICCVCMSAGVRAGACLLCVCRLR